MFLNDVVCTWIENGLGDEGGHNLGERCVVLSASVKNVFHNLC